LIPSRLQCENFMSPIRGPEMFLLKARPMRELRQPSAQRAAGRS
jgi:hypothetical protein